MNPCAHDLHPHPSHSVFHAENGLVFGDQQSLMDLRQIDEFLVIRVLTDIARLGGRFLKMGQTVHVRQNELARCVLGEIQVLMLALILTLTLTQKASPFLEPQLDVRVLKNTRELLSHHGGAHPVQFTTL